MNASLGDIRNTGNLDIYVSNAHVSLLREGSNLWVNDGVRQTSDVKKISDRAARMNAGNEEAWGWGAAMGDLDLDGRLDIVQANGFISNKYDAPAGKCPTPTFGDWGTYLFNVMASAVDPSVLAHADKWNDFRGTCMFAEVANKVYLNRGRGFVNVADKVGWTRRGESRGIALVDLNNTGRLDAIVTNQYEPVSIYRNELKRPKRWTGLQLEGNGKTCNRDAAGTRVTIRYTVDGKPFQHTREVQVANGFMAQGDRRLLFGLDDYEGDVSATINWCGQSPQQLTLANNKYMKVVQP
jgi:hypothetical protein